MKAVTPMPAATFSDSVMLRRTPIALAIALMQGVALAQPAQNTTSADNPGAAGQFETSGQPTIGPRPFTSFFERLSSPVDKITIKVAGDNLPADGVTGTDVVVELQDGKKQLIRDEVEVTIEVNGGARVLLSGRMTSESGADRGDINKIEPGVQAKVTGGLLKFKLVAPYKPDTVDLKVSIKGVVAKAVVRYVPDLREMVAVGLLEGRLRSDKFNPSQLVPVRDNDGFDNELRGFTRDFNGGSTHLGARAALYLKGKVKGDYLLTMAYDSDKPTVPKLFATVDPNSFYAVYGDSSVKGVDAQSSGKLYVRIDNKLSYLFFGDLTTSDKNPARTLSQYSRSLNGIRGHYEEGRITANSFIAQQSFTQVVDEFSGRGVSGPYRVSKSNGVMGSEVIEILVRDRNRPTIILKTTSLARSIDYEFEPLSGNILFKSAVPSFDDQQNPVSIRVTYEIDQGGPKFLVYGGDVRLKITDTLSIGVAAAKDKNPVTPYLIEGANVQLKLTPQTEIIAEVARSRGVYNANTAGFAVTSTNSLMASTGIETTGVAARAEIRHSSEDLRLRGYVSRADENFNNPSGGITPGRTEAGAQGTYKVTKNVTVNADFIHSADTVVGTKSDAMSVGADLKMSDKLTIGAGMRHVTQSAISLVSPTSYSCVNSAGNPVTTTPGYNAGYGISQTGGQQIDPATGLPITCTPISLPTAVPAATADLDRTSLYARATYKATERVSLNGEVQREMGDNATTLYRLGADWRVAEKTRLYTRYEVSRSYGGAYGLGVGDKASSLSLGMDTQYMQDGSVFSEYRLRDSASGRETQAAVGLRNGFKLDIVPGLKLLTNLERLASTTGRSVAGGVGLEYTGDPLWKASGRLEARHGDAANNYLVTLNLARKMDRNWTLIARDYMNITQPISSDPTVNTAISRQTRLQLGAAFRPVDNNRFDALSMYERRTTYDIVAGTNSVTDIFSLRGNYHPSRPWFISGRLAAKRVSELLLGSVNSSYAAGLAGARVTYDVTNKWSVGAITTMLVGQGGALQYAYGVEVGYTLADNLLGTLGYNWRGFSDNQLADGNYTNRGWVLGVRYKFDESLFGANDPAVNKTLSPTVAPAQP